MHREARGIARSSFCFLLLCFVAPLAGCAGGNFASGVPVTSSAITGAASHSAKATPTPAPSAYPLGAGETLVYSGTLTQKFQEFPEVVAPSDPSPEPPSITKTSVSQTVSVRTKQAFNGGTGLTDLHDVEIDAESSGLKTTKSTTDLFERVTTGSSSRLLNYGSQFADESGDTTTTSYAPQRIEDELPERGGAQWTNGAGAQVLEALAGNKKGSPVTVTRNVNSDGTYDESTTFPPGYSAPGFTGADRIQENTDGSGTFAFVSDGTAVTIDYSAPLPQATSSPVVAITEYDTLDPQPSTTPAFEGELPDWYGSTPEFYNEVDRDLGVVSVPAACKLRARFPKSAHEIQETIDTTDTVLGYIEQQVRTNYVAAGYGVLCTTLVDTQSLYYDFAGDQPFVFSVTPPLEITTVHETLALQPASAKTREAATQTAAPSGIAFDASPVLRAGFERSIETVRRQRAERIGRILLATRHRRVSR
jgi:hypothetical protein